MQVLRVCSFSTFALPPALPPCCCPLAFQPQVRRLTSRMSSESYPGYPECVVSCHGAGRPSSSHEGFSVAEAWMQHCWWKGRVCLWWPDAVRSARGRLGETAAPRPGPPRLYWYRKLRHENDVNYSYYRLYLWETIAVSKKGIHRH
jgi:hypothetical protein